MFSLFCFPSSSPPDTGSFRFFLTIKSYRTSCGYIVTRALQKKLLSLHIWIGTPLRKSRFLGYTIHGISLPRLYPLNILHNNFVSHRCLRRSNFTVLKATCKRAYQVFEKLFWTFGILHFFVFRKKKNGKASQEASIGKENTLTKKMFSFLLYVFFPSKKLLTVGTFVGTIKI